MDNDVLGYVSSFICYLNFKYVCSLRVMQPFLILDRKWQNKSMDIWADMSCEPISQVRMHLVNKYYTIASLDNEAANIIPNVKKEIST